MYMYVFIAVSECGGILPNEQPLSKLTKPHSMLMYWIQAITPQPHAPYMDHGECTQKTTLSCTA